MPLFQTAVLNKYLKQQDSARIDAAYAVFKGHFHAPEIQANIREAKEEQYQEGFLRDLFVNVLGYTLNPQPGYDLTSEFKNEKGAKKADGAILQDGKALGVVELKGMDTTDLSTINTQAFGYKANHTHCVYVVTSNFQKLRFFIDNAVEHAEWDLFTLGREDFRILWLCLQRDNLLAGLPKKVKAESLLEEEQVTKKLYKDYTAFKNALWQDLCANHPEHDKLELYKKSQKLLDRFLFILFSEDKGLLPPNTLPTLIAQWRKLQDLDAYQPLYERCQRYFGHLNTGHKSPSQEIFAYNGGLFKPDALLDTVRISDTVLETHLSTLTNYDFASEVDVNILGHIFEHSLNEIEAITAQLEGRALDTKKTKRKKDGVFYTPKYITKYIVENTVGRLCAEKKDELAIDDEEYARGRKGRQKKTIQELDTKLDVYRDWLLSLTICDPACGSGAFLNQALDFLIAEHQYVNELESKLLGQSIVFKDIGDHILERNIYGVDINEESVEIARLSLWLRTATKGRKLNDLSGNIKCGNSLIDDPAVAGAKAFDWKKEFPAVFAKGGFDVVVGNPPYVRVQFLPHREIDWYKEHKETAYKRVDISILFFELAQHILRTNGRVSFITSNQFQAAEYGRNLRKLLLSKLRIDTITDFGDLPVFEEALTYVSVYSLVKATPADFVYIKVNNLNEARNESYSGAITIGIKSLTEETWQLVDNREAQLLGRLQKFRSLGDVGNAWAGLFTGLDAVLMFDAEGMRASGIEEGLFLPVIRASDPVRHGNAYPSMYVIYPYKEVGDKTEVLTEEELSLMYPIGYKYLLEHKAALQARKDSRKTFGDRPDWFALTRFGRKAMYQQPKIVSPGEVRDHKFSLDSSGSGFSCARVFAITATQDVSAKGLMAVLNSSTIRFFLHRLAAIKAGGYFSYSSAVLNRVPLPASFPPELVGKVDVLLEANEQLLTLNQQFLLLLRSKYTLPTLSRALENWPSLDFKGFLKELKKAKVQLSLAEEAEWLGYFTAEQAKAQALQAQIAKTDKEIDALVYGLYGLTEEEVKVVEGKA